MEEALKANTDNISSSSTRKANEASKLGTEMASSNAMHSTDCPMSINQPNNRTSIAGVLAASEPKELPLDTSTKITTETAREQFIRLNLAVRYERFHFDRCRRNLKNYTHAMLARSYLKGIKLSREDVNHFWRANIESVYPEYCTKQRDELLQQVSLQLRLLLPLAAW